MRKRTWNIAIGESSWSRYRSRNLERERASAGLSVIPEGLRASSRREVETNLGVAMLSVLGPYCSRFAAIARSPSSPRPSPDASRV